MPLGTREVLLFLRAKDQASRVINEVGRNLAGMDAASRRAMDPGQAIRYGSALTGAGLAATALGVAGIAAFTGMAKAASEYSNQAALTFTQVRKGATDYTTTLEDVKKIGLDVARTLPVAFEQIQPALFDIFSSMEVGGREAAIILEGMGKAAVAGATDIQTAGRSIITVMNGFQMAMGNAAETQDSLNKALDFQFTMVKRGVGTYEEFASVIGRAVPAFAAAGQEMEQLGGAMTFLTQRGLSTAMAATSAARAIELLTKPESIANMEAMGIAVRDASGEFLPLNEIVTQLGQKFEDLSKPEQIAMFKDLFGQGTIQARRFFALAIPQWELFNKEVEAFTGNAGTMEEAFRTMMVEPAQQFDLLRNRLKVVAIEFGSQLIPVVLEAANAFSILVSGFENLDPAVKAFIARGGLLVSILLAVGGAVTALLGVWNMLVGGFATFADTSVAAANVALKTFAGTAFGLIAIVSALGFSLQDLVGFLGNIASLVGSALGQPMVQAGLAVFALSKAFTAARAALIAFSRTAIATRIGVMAIEVADLVRQLGFLGAAGRGIQNLSAAFHGLTAAIATPVGLLAAFVGAIALSVFEANAAKKALDGMVQSFKELIISDPSNAMSQINEKLSEVRENLEGLEQASFGDFFTDMFDFLPGVEGATTRLNRFMEEEKALIALQKEAKAAFNAANPAIADMAEGLTAAGEAAGMSREKIAFMTEEAEKLATEVSGKFSEMGNIWADFAEKGAASMDKMIAKAKEMLDIANTVAKDMRALIAKGVPADILKGVIDEVGVAGAKGIFGEMLKADQADLQQLISTLQTLGITAGEIGADFGEAASGISNMAGEAERLSLSGDKVASFMRDASGAMSVFVETSKGMQEVGAGLQGSGVFEVFNQLRQDLGLSAADAQKLVSWMGSLSGIDVSGLTVAMQQLTGPLGMSEKQAANLLRSVTNVNSTPMTAIMAALDGLIEPLGLTQSQAELARTKLQEMNGADLGTLLSALSSILKEVGGVGPQADAARAALDAMADTYYIDVITRYSTQGAPSAGVENTYTGAVTDPDGVIEGPMQKHLGGLIRHMGGIIPRLHGGGGLKGDEVVAVLQKGEYVLRRSAVNDIGKEALDRLNAYGREALQGRGGAGSGSIDSIFSQMAATIDQAISEARRSLGTGVYGSDSESDNESETEQSGSSDGSSTSGGNGSRKPPTMQEVYDQVWGQLNGGGGKGFNAKPKPPEPTSVERHYHLHITGGDTNRVLSGFNLLQQFT